MLSNPGENPFEGGRVDVRQRNWLRVILHDLQLLCSNKTYYRRNLIENPKCHKKSSSTTCNMFKQEITIKGLNKRRDKPTNNLH